MFNNENASSFFQLAVGGGATNLTFVLPSCFQTEGYRRLFVIIMIVRATLPLFIQQSCLISKPKRKKYKVD